ncbi:MAG TPA: response regulator [Lutibacter sp.]|nr:response regulator [Lutibacter sp.]
MQHILIVEDEWIIYDSLAQFFISKGYSVSKYTKSYESAMVAAREQRPDIALLDIELEGALNGIQVGKALKEMYQTPLLYLSNIQDQTTRKLALSTQPNGYFFKSKNASNEELLTNVQLAIQQASQQVVKKVKYIQAHQDFIKKTRKDQDTNDIPQVKLKLSEIYYFKTNSTNNSYISLVLDHDDYVKRISLKELYLSNQLPINFIITNRTHIVNLFMVLEFNASRLKMFDGEIIKISRQNRKRVKDRFDSLFL